MREGKATKAKRILLQALEELSHMSSDYSASLLNQAIEKVQPSFYLVKMRKRGRAHQIPACLPPHSRESMAIRWILHGAQAKKKRNPKKAFSSHLASELLDCLKNDAYGIRKRDELHRQVEANRASARMRWW